MKKTLILTFGILLTLSSWCFAVNLDSFIVESQYISNGYVQVNANPQIIKADVTISRSFIPGTHLYEPVDWTVVIVLKDNNSLNQTIIASPLRIVTSDFSGAYCNKVMTINVPAINHTSNTQLSTTYNSNILLEYSPNDYSRFNSFTPNYSVSSYPVQLNFVTHGNGPVGCAIDPSQKTVWNGCIYNTVFDGFAVPFPVAQYYVKNDPTFGTFYGSFDWTVADSNYPNQNLPGTIINFDDVNPILTQNESIFSPNKNYRLTLQTDGNLVLSTVVGDQFVTLWTSNTQGTTNQTLFYKTNGQLSIYNGASISTPVVWQSDVYDKGGSLTRFAQPNNVMSYPYYKLQDNGNLVMYWPNGVQSVANGSARAMKVIFAATDSGPDWSGPSKPASPHFGSVGRILRAGSTLYYGETPCNNFEITH